MCVRESVREGVRVYLCMFERVCVCVCVCVCVGKRE